MKQASYFLITFFVTYFAYAAEAVELGDHGGQILHSTNRSAEVKIDPVKRSIRVYLKKDPHNNPDAVEVIVTDKDGRLMNFELHALSPAEAGMSVYSGALLPGSLNSNKQSYMGVELKIPLGKESPEYFRRKR